MVTWVFPFWNLDPCFLAENTTVKASHYFASLSAGTDSDQICILGACLALVSEYGHTWTMPGMKAPIMKSVSPIYLNHVS